MAHLWTEARSPIEYIEYVLMKEVYHCTRAEIRSQPASDFYMDFACLAAESYVHSLRSNHARVPANPDSSGEG